ncbi:hypothetical protein [Flagellimonas oceanensis]|jgi:predicted flap endonuclease-1-like 5' DNA nuclease|uniref:hypothetical protein n=2 Tax=Flagellimonas oceanensis TaxID=2499163 RepID=UPI001F44B4D3|nr:hypothetical protein [Allomuricauda oceanensis]
MRSSYNSFIMDWIGSTMWYWIVLAITGIISGVLGYFFGKSDTPSLQEKSFEINSLEIQNAKLKSDLETCRKRLDSYTTTSKELQLDKDILTRKESFSFDAQHAKAALGKTIKENDLKLVEGIGPKIEGLFHNFGIKTWKELAETSADKCQEVLDSGGKRYRIHDPASWPMQAKMAYEGHWEQLFEWQEKHRAGKY